MRPLRERVQSLLQCLPRRQQRLLRLVITCITVHIHLVTARAEKLRLEHLGCRCDEIRGEIHRGRCSEAKLARGRF